MDNSWSLLDYADTSLSTRVDSALYDETIASFAFGVRLTDADSPLAPAYLMQVEAALQGEHVVLQVGRRRRPSVGVSMPTLRDEDLLHFIYPLNPYSTGGLEEDAIFTDIISTTFRMNFRWHGQVFVESLRDTTQTGDPADRAGIEPNSGGIRLFYDQLPALQRVSVVRHVGVGFFAQRGGSRIPQLGRDVLWQAKAESSINLWPDPIHLVDVRSTVLYQHGTTDAPFESVSDTWRGRYVSGALAFRYLYAPSQVDRFQAGVSFGFRSFIEQQGWETAVIPNVVYQAGANVDLVLQYAYTRRSDSLSFVEGLPGQEHRIELAVGYRFSVALFNTVNIPRDLVNADYNYVPVN